MATKEKERIILGIDPGTTIMGYGIILESNKTMELVTMGVIKLAHLSSHALKLQHIFKRVSALIQEYHPDAMALEAPFYGKNVQSMLKLGRAQGVAMAAGLQFEVPSFEYAPRKVKLSITGNGNAGKEQVANMLQTLLKFKEIPQFLDATDGLAVAVCHAFQNSNKVSQKGYSSWESFVKGNQKRLV